MKSIFLVFILATSFSPLIFTSDVSPSGAAAAVAVAAENLAAEKLFCMFCKKDRGLIPCWLHPDCNCNCGCRMICHFCKTKLITKLMAETILAEQAAKERAAAAEQRAQTAAAEVVGSVAQARKAKKAVCFLTKVYFFPLVFKSDSDCTSDSDLDSNGAAVAAASKRAEEIKVEKRHLPEQTARDKRETAEIKAANKWLETNRRAVERIKAEKAKKR